MRRASRLNIVSHGENVIPWELRAILGATVPHRWRASLPEVQSSNRIEQEIYALKVKNAPRLSLSRLFVFLPEHHVESPAEGVQICPEQKVVPLAEDDANARQSALDPRPLAAAPAVGGEAPQEVQERMRG